MSPDQKERLTNLRRHASRARNKAESISMSQAEDPDLMRNLDAWQKQLEELLQLEKELK